jgi:hypothetical protein
MFINNEFLNGLIVVSPMFLFGIILLMKLGKHPSERNRLKSKS